MIKFLLNKLFRFFNFFFNDELFVWFCLVFLIKILSSVNILFSMFEVIKSIILYMIILVFIYGLFLVCLILINIKMLNFIMIIIIKLVILSEILFLN